MEKKEKTKKWHIVSPFARRVLSKGFDSALCDSLTLNMDAAAADSKQQLLSTYCVPGKDLDMCHVF